MQLPGLWDVLWSVVRFIWFNLGSLLVYTIILALVLEPIGYWFNSHVIDALGKLGAKSRLSDLLDYQNQLREVELAFRSKDPEVVAWAQERVEVLSLRAYRRHPR